MRAFGRALERGALGFVAVIVGGLLAVGGIAGIAGTKIVEQQRLATGTVVTAAVVQRIAPRAAVVEYEVQGAVQRSTVDSVTWNLSEEDLAPGTQLRAVYDGGRPDRLWILSDAADTKRWWWRVILSGIVLALLGFAVSPERVEAGKESAGKA